MRFSLKLSMIVVAASGGLAGCSSSDGSDPTGSGSATIDPKIDPKTGLPFCAADAALRTSDACVDPKGAVLCKTDTGYPGDELAMCPTDPSKAMVLHYGPKNYDDPAELAKYTLPAGGEDENCIWVHSPNTADVYVRNFHGRMRPNSHHLIVTTSATEVPDSTRPSTCQGADNVGSRWLLGSQDPQIDVSIGASGEPAVPGEIDYGLAQSLKANTPVKIQMHYINTTSEEILREAWIYLEYVEKEKVVNLVDMITFYQGAISVPPLGSSQTAKAACAAPSKRWVGLLTGHFHENGTRFSVWKRDLAGVETLVYETYDWEDPGNLYYRDKVTNTPPDPQALRHGGWDGYLPLEVGESLVFQCAFNNPTNQTVTLGDMGADQMCNVFGVYYPTDGDVWSCACAGEGCF